MSGLIKEAFTHVAELADHVMKGHYDLIDPDGCVILPSLWEDVARPGDSITMLMWPIPIKSPIKLPPNFRRGPPVVIKHPAQNPKPGRPLRGPSPPPVLKREAQNPTTGSKPISFRPIRTEEANWTGAEGSNREHEMSSRPGIHPTNPFPPPRRSSIQAMPQFSLPPPPGLIPPGPPPKVFPTRKKDTATSYVSEDSNGSEGSDSDIDSEDDIHNSLSDLSTGSQSSIEVPVDDNNDALCFSIELNERPQLARRDRESLNCESGHPSPVTKQAQILRILGAKPHMPEDSEVSIQLTQLANESDFARGIPGYIEWM